MARVTPAARPGRERIVDWVYDELRRAIVDEQLDPGERLSVPELAGELAVSRSPVREAVLRLVRDGMAVEVPHKGAVVARVELSLLRELYRVREVLEGLGARLAAQRRTDEDLVEIERAIRSHEDVLGRDDLRGHVVADSRFHTLLSVVAGNGPLLDHHRQIQGQIQLGMRMTTRRSSPSGRRLAIAEHREIAELVRAGDPEGAEAAARAHVRRVGAWLDEAPASRATQGHERVASS